MPVLDRPATGHGVIIHRSAPPDADIAPLVTAYFNRLGAHLRQHFDIAFDSDAAITRTLSDLSAFLPPDGALATARPTGAAPVGFGLLRTLRAGTGELTRIYVQPQARGHGLGRALAERLLAESERLGHRRLLLCSSGWQVPAHRLYRSLGFREIGPYPDCESPPDLAPYMVFLQRDLPA